MRIEEIDTLDKVIKELKSKILEGCKGTKNCQEIHEDFNNWCRTCTLKCAIYYIEKLYEQNEAFSQIVGGSSVNKQTH